MNARSDFLIRCAKFSGLKDTSGLTVWHLFSFLCALERDPDPKPRKRRGTR
jgi:hypothetical protein